MTNPFENYKQQAVSTMSPGEQIITLFDAALKNIRVGAQLYKAGDYDNAEAVAEKSKNIFRYLSGVLNRNIAISNDLYQLYDFLIREVIRAQVRRDPLVLEGIVPVVENMRDTWVQAEKLCHQQRG